MVLSKWLFGSSFRLSASGPAGEGEPWVDGFHVGDHHQRVHGEEVEMLCGRGDYGFSPRSSFPRYP